MQLTAKLLKPIRTIILLMPLLVGSVIMAQDNNFYHETYRRDANGWRIASIELRRVHTELGGPWRRT